MECYIHAQDQIAFIQAMMKFPGEEWENRGRELFTALAEAAEAYRPDQRDHRLHPKWGPPVIENIIARLGWSRDRSQGWPNSAHAFEALKLFAELAIEYKEGGFRDNAT